MSEAHEFTMVIVDNVEGEAESDLMLCNADDGCVQVFATQEGARVRVCVDREELIAGLVQLHDNEMLHE